MIVDCHVHILAMTAAHGKVSAYLRKRPNVFLARFKFGIPFFATDDVLEQAFENRLALAVNQTPELDAVVGLAFDAVHTEDGQLDLANTHLHVTNDYAAALARKHPKILFGASIHPYRKDAVAELERCVAAGAVLVKWLPLVQGFDPGSEKCRSLFEAMAHHRIPLLSHTGGELSLPQCAPQFASPKHLELALKCGVTVIAAHCGTRSQPFGECHLDTFIRMAKEHERFFGDTSALCLPTRSYAIPRLMKDHEAMRKLVHGSDWPVVSLPPLRMGVVEATQLMLTQRNWLRRDVLAKRALGFDDEFFHRAGTLLRRL
ncbi:MAG: amidohydrolase family protein [Gemmataceae bacterium]